MSKTLSTILLAVGAFVMVGAGAFVIVTAALVDDDEDSSASDTSTVSEQHVYLMNLGMG